MEPWKKCGTCKKPLAFGQSYWACSVSTCNRVRFHLAFCSLACWDAHVPVMNHRSAWAEEKMAPKAASTSDFARLPGRSTAPTPGPPGPALRDIAGDPDTARRRVARPPTGSPLDSADRDVLIVASKLKKYIRDRSGLNTSADVLDILSDIVRGQCDTAIRQAREEGRKTVKARDFR